MPGTQDRLIATSVLVIAVLVGLGLTMLTLFWVGASFDDLARRAQIVEDKVSSDIPFQLNDGTRVTVWCWRPELPPAVDRHGVPANRWFSCRVEVGAVELFKLEMWNTSDESVFRSSMRFFDAPALVDGAPAASPNKITLAPDEKLGREYDVGELIRTIPFCFNIKFYVEEDSLKALFVSGLQESARLAAVRIDEFSVNRIARHLVDRVKVSTGFFGVRTDWKILLIGGTFQTIVVFVFFLSLTLSFIVFIQLSTGVFPLRADSVDNLGVLAGTLGGSLTYFGLLGTLLGIFLAVGELSSIDFVDEMKKVFDQTRSFGAMSLALGSSVLGLGGALALWILQALANFICGRKVFEL